jgi:hypothetical protein
MKAAITEEPGKITGKGSADLRGEVPQEPKTASTELRRHGKPGLRIEKSACGIGGRGENPKQRIRRSRTRTQMGNFDLIFVRPLHHVNLLSLPSYGF